MYLVWHDDRLIRRPKCSHEFNGKEDHNVAVNLMYILTYNVK